MKSSKEKLISDCKKLLKAFNDGNLGQTIMPEDSHPIFKNQEERLAYFTLPMALNYQRDSYKLWESVLKTYKDPNTVQVFDTQWVANTDAQEQREKLLKYKLALQPNKHINTWKRISETITTNWNTFDQLLTSARNDFLKLQTMVQKDYKKGFPYLSGPKIFNYWTFIISTYGKVKLTNRDSISIAPDTHITQCSVKLGVITPDQARALSKDEIANIWKEILSGSGIDPIDMHPPLWFWSKNGFIYELN